MTKLSEERLSEIRMECEAAACVKYPDPSAEGLAFLDYNGLAYEEGARTGLLRTGYAEGMFHQRLRAEDLVDLLREATSVCKYHACPQCGKTGKEVGMMQVGRPTGINPLDGKPSAASALRMDVETCTVCQGRSALLSRIEEGTKPTTP